MKKEDVLAFVRHTLTFVGAYLVTKGVIGPEQVEMLPAVSGGVLAIIGFAWSFFDKKATRVKVQNLRAEVTRLNSVKVN